MKKIWVKFKSFDDVDGMLLEEPDAAVDAQYECVTIEDPAQQEFLDFFFEATQGEDFSGLGGISTVMNSIELDLNLENDEFILCCYGKDENRAVRVFKLCKEHPLPTDINGEPIDTIYGTFLDTAFSCLAASINYSITSNACLGVLSIFATLALQHRMKKKAAAAP